MRLKFAASALAVLAVGGGASALVAGIAFAAPAAPTDVSVTRNASTPTDVTVRWTAVTGATRYNVSVFDGVKDTTTTVAGTTTSFKLAQSPCTRYRVSVASRDASGAGGTSKNVFVDITRPGGISNLKASSNAASTAVSATWTAPTNPGVRPKGSSGPAVQYRVQIVGRSSVSYVNGVRVVTPLKVATVTTTNATLSGLNPDDAPFMLTVMPETGGATSGGDTASCPTSKGVLFVGDNTATVVNPKATRSATKPSEVTVSWAPPNYAISSPVTSYVVRYGEMVGTTEPATFTAKTVTTTSTTLSLDWARKWMVKINPVSALGEGGTVIMRVNPVEALDANKPTVTVRNTGDTIRVSLTTRAGSYKAYPKVRVQIKEAISGETAYTDEATLATGAADFLFTALPQRRYNVTVSAVGSKGEQELLKAVRDLRPIADVGRTLRSGDFTALPFSAAGATGDDLITTTPLATSNMTFATTVTEPSTSLWLRASVSQVGGKNVITGYRVTMTRTSVVVESYRNGVACGTKVAEAKYPANWVMPGVTEHRLVLVASGNTLKVRDNYDTMLEVPNLTAAQANACGSVPAPTGAQAGIRSPVVNGTSGLDRYSRVTFG